jgi:hypothetical protein
MTSRVSLVTHSAPAAAKGRYFQNAGKVTGRARNAVETGFVEEVTEDDVAWGLDAAPPPWVTTASRSSCRAGLTPESWTHGSAEQRQPWFLTGYRDGDPPACDTFSASSLERPGGAGRSLRPLSPASCPS